MQNVSFLHVLLAMWKVYQIRIVVVEPFAVFMIFRSNFRIVPMDYQLLQSKAIVFVQIRSYSVEGISN